MHWEEPAHNLKSCLDMFVRFAVFFSDLKTAAVLSLLTAVADFGMLLRLEEKRICIYLATD